MKLIAAFRWDASNRTMSYLIIRTVPFGFEKPMRVKCGNKDYRSLIRQTVKKFFALLNANTNPRNVVIHYKTYIDSHIPEYYTPRPDTYYVEQVFQKELRLYHLRRRAHKMRALLSGRKNIHAFKKFVSLLCYNGQTIRSDVYKLWQIAFHVTKSNVDASARKLYQMVTGQSLRRQENKENFLKVWQT